MRLALLLSILLIFMPDLRSAPTSLACAQDKSYKIFKQKPCPSRGHRVADCCWLLRCYGRCCWHTAVGATAVAAGLGAVAAWVVLPAAAAGAACCWGCLLLGLPAAGLLLLGACITLLRQKLRQRFTTGCVAIGHAGGGDDDERRRRCRPTTTGLQGQRPDPNQDVASVSDSQMATMTMRR